MAVLLDIRNLTIQFPRVGRPRVGRAFLPANQQVAPQATFTAVRDITFSANTLYASMLPHPMWPSTVHPHTSITPPRDVPH